MVKFFLRFIFINIFLISSSYSEIIKDVKISGNKRISKETIIVLGNISPGINYDDNQLDKLTKELYRTQFFKDLSITINNSILTINVVENPIIEDIQISGVKKDSVTELLQEKISLKNRKSFTDYALQNDINLIKNILKSNGYYFVKVSPSVQKDDDLNTIRIMISVDQGPRAKVKNISFIGDKKIKDKKLLEIIATEEHKFWKFISNNVYLDQSRIDLDKRLIENYYKNLGYYDVNVLNSFAELNENGNFNLVYNISAGDFYFFNDLKLNLPPDYNAKDFEKIQDNLLSLKGEKYSIDDFNNILSDIENIALLRLYDFIDAKVDEQILKDNKINFVFNVYDSTKYYVEKINILGNFQTIEEVIRNRLVVAIF